jgi:hypothetical protein
VIQKCLNTLPPEDNQFIYNAVAANCIEVATHRHGCCVLQRCIDHASESQRIQLVTEITYQSLSLVQDAFGVRRRVALSLRGDIEHVAQNYVVQYIVDCDSRFAEAIVRQFLGNVSTLSCQKFSSNVVEKVRSRMHCRGRRLSVPAVHPGLGCSGAQGDDRRAARPERARAPHQRSLWQLCAVRLATADGSVH